MFFAYPIISLFFSGEFKGEVQGAEAYQAGEQENDAQN